MVTVNPTTVFVNASTNTPAAHRFLLHTGFLSCKPHSNVISISMISESLLYIRYKKGIGIHAAAHHC